jgi:hypothetical protein
MVMVMAGRFPHCVPHTLGLKETIEPATSSISSITHEKATAAGLGGYIYGDAGTRLAIDASAMARCHAPR